MIDMSNSESQNKKVKEEESPSLIIQARTFFHSLNRMPKRDSLIRKSLMQSEFYRKLSVRRKAATPNYRKYCRVRVVP